MVSRCLVGLPKGSRSFLRSCRFGPESAGGSRCGRGLQPSSGGGGHRDRRRVTDAIPLPSGPGRRHRPGRLPSRAGRTCVENRVAIVGAIGPDVSADPPDANDLDRSVLGLLRVRLACLVIRARPRRGLGHDGRLRLGTQGLSLLRWRLWEFGVCGWPILRRRCLRSRGGGVGPVHRHQGVAKARALKDEGPAFLRRKPENKRLVLTGQVGEEIVRVDEDRGLPLRLSDRF